MQRRWKGPAAVQTNRSDLDWFSWNYWVGASQEPATPPSPVVSQVGIEASSGPPITAATLFPTRAKKFNSSRQGSPHPISAAQHQEYYAAGESAAYTSTGESVSVLRAHMEDPHGVYYTVRMEDGREKQTVHDKLRRL